MTIKEFISAAIEGGYKGNSCLFYMQALYHSPNLTSIANREGVIEIIILDPLAWKAVAQTKGWQGKSAPMAGTSFNIVAMLPGQFQQAVFIERLWMGETIEKALEYIATL